MEPHPFSIIAEDVNLAGFEINSDPSSVSEEEKFREETINVSITLGSLTMGRVFDGIIGYVKLQAGSRFLFNSRNALTHIIAMTSSIFYSWPLNGAL